MNLISSNNLFIKLDVAYPVDVITSYMTPDTGGASGDAIHITTTTATVIIPAPGSGFRRRMTDLNVRALASNPGAVTATLYQGVDTTNLFEVFSAQLLPADVMTYDHQAGFRVIAQALLGNALTNIYTQINPQLLI
jgi:hypothetical protein